MVQTANSTEMSTYHKIQLLVFSIFTTGVSCFRRRKDNLSPKCYIDVDKPSVQDILQLSELVKILRKVKETLVLQLLDAKYHGASKEL